MRLIDLKKAFSMGSLIKATVEPISSGWALSVLCTNGEVVIMHKDRNGIREFKTTAAAIESAKMIGFDEILIKGIQKK
jgi:hypothetical protein